MGHGDQLDPAELVADLVAGGYRREDLVEHRGEVAVRGSIVDVFPSTADVPIRIDLWGDEVDRLTQFSVTDQRSTIDLSEVEIFPCRELLPTDEVRGRAESLMASEPVGSRAVGAPQRWPHVRRHGVVAAVAHRGRAHAVRPARRLGPGAARRPAPHARPGRRHPGRGSRPGPDPGRDLGGHRQTSRRCTCRSTGCSPPPEPRPGPSPAPPRDPTWPPCWPRAGRRWSATAPRWCASSPTCWPTATG